MKNPLEARWLAEHGVAAAALPDLLRRAGERRRQYPWLVRLAYPLAAAWVRRVAPLLLLGLPVAAEALSRERFARLEARLASFPLPRVRALYHLFRLPLLELLVAEEPPRSQTAHPLARYAPDPPPAGATFDVAVVGSGAGGAPLAWDLARRGFRVALIEAGTVARGGTTAEVLRRHYVEQGLLVALDLGLFPVLAGRAVGGSTAINSGTCLRPPPERLAAWDRQAGTRLTEELPPWLDRAERLLRVGVPPRELLGASSRLFEAGLDRLGRVGAFVLPRNAPDCIGSGLCCFVCPSGAKRGTDLAFIPEAIEAGCTLLAGMRATRIRVTGREVRLDLAGAGRQVRLRARHLVLAGGALGTPGLIRGNRLGARWRLAGDHLRVHPAIKVFAHFPAPVHGERGVPQGLGYRDPALPRCMFEGVFTPRAAAAKMLGLTGQRLRWWLDTYDHVASFGASIQDRATGRIRYVGDTPLVWYRPANQDARDLGAAALSIAEAFLAAGADRVLLPVFCEPREIGSPAELRSARVEAFTAGSILAGAFHPHGTAGIGRVVDGDLALASCETISVCDASVFPDSPGVNPMVTIVALSLRLADRLARELAGAPS